MEKVLTNDSKLDWLGIFVSCFCAFHCAAMPYLLSLSPLLIDSFLVDEKTELVLFSLAFVVGLGSLIPSYFRHHGKIQPIAVFCVGFLLILAGRFAFEEESVLEVIFSGIGAVVFAVAHFINYRLCQKCCEV